LEGVFLVDFLGGGGGEGVFVTVLGNDFTAPPIPPVSSMAISVSVIVPVELLEEFFHFQLGV